jgi:hypothetical protein
MPTQRAILTAVVLVVLTVLGLVLFQVMGSPGAASGTDVSLTPPVAPSSSSKPRTEVGVRAAVPTRVERQDDPEQADPRERVRGEVIVAPGLKFPEEFEVLAKGGEAQPRVWTFRGEKTVVTLDLEPGRWTLFARADGLASRPLVIERNADVTLPPFRLVLEASGRLGGQVLDARGVGLAGLPVLLVSNSPRDALSTNSDAQGRYAFADVPLGAYRLCFGSSDSPIVPVVSVNVQALEVSDIPPQTMPELGEGEIRIVDRENQPVAGARVFGAGSRGGWIDGFSDASGLLKASFLPEGSFFLDVHALDERKGQGQLEVHAGRIAKANIQIR